MGTTLIDLGQSIYHNGMIGLMHKELRPTRRVVTRHFDTNRCALIESIEGLSTGTRVSAAHNPGQMYAHK